MIVNRVSPGDAKYGRWAALGSVLLAGNLVCAAGAASFGKWPYFAFEVAVCIALATVVYFDVRAARRH